MQESPRERREQEEKNNLSEHAALSLGANETRLHKVAPDHFRTEFERDYTRIIHSRAFRRLRHKTQVFLSPENDHVSTRIEHVLHVASISKTITRALKLNEDLALAIAVGHDLGHAPFGHIGEEILNEIAEQEFNGRFWHEEHSLTIVDTLENMHGYTDPGLNLTHAVRDGIACHYGESFPPELKPDKKKKHILKQRKEDRPCTVEGCVVRVADVIAYLGRDLEDGETVELVKGIPDNVAKVLGKSNREIIAVLIRDVCQNYRGDGVIRFSPDISEISNELKNFNYKCIYKSELVTRRKDILKEAIRRVFYEICHAIEPGREDISKIGTNVNTLKPKLLKVLKDFAKDDFTAEKLSVPDGVKKCALYFIAGMTDNYFLSAFQNMLEPEI